MSNAVGWIILVGICVWLYYAGKDVGRTEKERELLPRIETVERFMKFYELLAAAKQNEQAPAEENPARPSQ